MKLKLICSECGLGLDIKSLHGLTFAITPCPCAKAVEEDLYPELGNNTPIRLPYLTLARILVRKVVNVTYRKKNGDIRELIGYLGTNDLRHVDSLLHYFHELDDDGVDSEIGGGLVKTNCKCLLVDRMINITHYDSESGIQTIYEVEEYF